MPPSPIIRSKKPNDITGSIKKGPMKMSEAQELFRNVVKSELDCLLSAGWERASAVQALLGRIVEYSESPGQEEVWSVMEQFKMNKEDATRALIVKQELGRLKRRGLNPLEAIEELTMKMQGMGSSISKNNNSLSSVEEEYDDDEEEEDEEEFDEEDVPHFSPTDDHTTSVEHVFDAFKKLPSIVSSRRTTSFTPKEAVINTANETLKKAQVKKLKRKTIELGSTASNNKWVSRKKRNLASTASSTPMNSTDHHQLSRTLASTTLSPTGAQQKHQHNRKNKRSLEDLLSSSIAALPTEKHKKRKE